MRAVSDERPRVVIAVEPTLLAGALTEVLSRAGVDEIVDLTDQHVNAAVVSVPLSEHTNADIVIELPDSEGGIGVGHVRTERGATDVPITGMESILELLDRYCPAAVRRSKSEASSRSLANGHSEAVSE